MTRLQWTKEEIVKKAAFAKYRTLARPTDRAFSIDELIFYDTVTYMLSFGEISRITLLVFCSNNSLSWYI